MITATSPRVTAPAVEPRARPAGRNRRRRRAAGPTYLVAALAFLYLPVAVVVLFSFNADSTLKLPITGFSLRWYDQVLTDPTYTMALKHSLFVAGVCAVCTTLIGTLAAFGLTRVGPRLRGSLAVLFFVPITLPGLFLGLSLLTWFSKLNIQLSLWTVAAAHVVYTFPYFLLVARSVLDRIDPQYDEIAADLGASSTRRFLKVTLPMTWPILAAAGLLSFVLSFDEFFITFFVIGPDSTVPLVVYSAMRRAIDPSINAFATLLMLITLLSGVAIAVLARAGRTVKKGVKAS
jgi:spermidine/putrescine transport system permease protein